MNTTSKSELGYRHDRFNGSKPLKTPEAAAQATDAASDWKESLETWIGGHPHLCVGAALAVGVTIGWLVKRR